VPRRHVVVVVAFVAAVLCAFPSSSAADGGIGSFSSSDPLLDSIWAASVRTAEDSVSKPVDLDSRDCVIDLPLVLLDSPQRDRCPYIGDQAVDGLTLLEAGEDEDVDRDMIEWYAEHQNTDGSIPSSPIFDAGENLIDYNAYWIESLYDYVLYTGDTAFLKSTFPVLTNLVDRFYTAHMTVSGLLANWKDAADYADIQRGGLVVAYYNGEFARALGMASDLADWEGSPDRAAAWRAREQKVGAAFGAAFWDPAAGAFQDTASSRALHPEDGNAFAVLAGLATPAQARSALAYLSANESRPWGNTISDSSLWDRPGWGDGATERVYPFISYYEVLARYAAGEDDSALELIRREWGWMLKKGPGTMWENIGEGGLAPVNSDPSYDHGWSSGAAPALTNFVLGVEPTSPGFATFTVTPHPSDVTSASGDVPTPHGTIHVSWTISSGVPQVDVSAPRGTEWTNAPSSPYVAIPPAAIEHAILSGLLFS
jgi:Bacterial alpha-L-rhamnosidase 6 hairpin glycosidase domain/Bacterial alpha-L-rhamnosidase C-terminal domain